MLINLALHGHGFGQDKKGSSVNSAYFINLCHHSASTLIAYAYLQQVLLKVLFIRQT
jgi:hypothetical protein